MDGITWLLFGDFNEILDIIEKCGRIDRDERQMREFMKVLNDCDMRDFGYCGIP